MTKFSLFLSRPLFFVVLIFFASCSKENIKKEVDSSVEDRQVNKGEKALFDNDFLVPIESAQLIAERINMTVSDALKIGRNSINKVEAAFTLPTEDGSPALYIFNYEKDGFIVISADERHNPICAIVPIGKYEKVEAPLGLIEWLEVTAHYISMLRKNEIDNTIPARKQWLKVLNDIGEGSRILYEGCCPECPYYPDCIDFPDMGCGGYVDCPYVDPCGSYTTITKGPYLTTTWNQGCTYNEQCPNKNCDACFSNDNAWTGCVATAISQVLRYWAHPHTQGYNYASMPNFSGNSEVQRMMRDVGNSVDMDYGCDGSGADSDKTPGSFKNTFGYSSASRSSYGSGSYQTVKSNLDFSRPVILDACRTRTNRFLGLIYTYSNCHAWVCDGYQSYQNNCYGYLYFHMNWGWGGSYNGWYAFNSWTPGSYNYQYAKDFCYNIYP